MARYRTAEGTDVYHDKDGFAHPPGSEIEKPDDHVPSITWIPLDAAAEAAMKRRSEGLAAMAEARAAEVVGPLAKEKIRAEARQKIADVASALARAKAEMELVTPVRIAPQTMSELAMTRPTHDRGGRQRSDKGQG